MEGWEIVEQEKDILEGKYKSNTFVNEGQQVKYIQT